MPRRPKRNAGKPLRLHDSDPNEGTNPGPSGQCEPNSETLNQDDNTTLLDCVQALETLLAQTADNKANKANCATPRTNKRPPSSSSSSDSETRERRSHSKTRKNKKSRKHNKSAKRSRSSSSSSDSSSDLKYSDSTDSTDSSPTPHARPKVSFGTCLGNSVKDKIKKKIIQHKYIDLGLLLPTEHATNTSDSEIQELLSYPTTLDWWQDNTTTGSNMMKLSAEREKRACAHGWLRHYLHLQFRPQTPQTSKPHIESKPLFTKMAYKSIKGNALPSTLGGCDVNSACNASIPTNTISVVQDILHTKPVHTTSSGFTAKQHTMQTHPTVAATTVDHQAIPTPTTTDDKPHSHIPDHYLLQLTSLPSQRI